MSLPYTHDSSPVMTVLSKSGSLQRCYCAKFSNFWTIFASARFMPKTSVKIAWHKPKDMPTSVTSLIVIWRLTKSFSSLLQCFHRLLLEARATRTSIIINIFSTFLKPQLNLCSAHGRLAKRHSQHFKCPCTLNFIYNYSVRIIDLVSHTTIVVCVNFLYISGKGYSLKSTPNDSFFWETFHGNLIYSQSFCQKSAEKYASKKYYFRISFGWRCQAWSLNGGRAY